MKVTAAGFPCVALMGSSLSEAQQALLCRHFKHVVLMFDGDQAGRAATEDCLQRLARKLFVKAIMLPDGQQPDMFSTEELEEFLR